MGVDELSLVSPSGVCLGLWITACRSPESEDVSVRPKSLNVRLQFPKKCSTCVHFRCPPWTRLMNGMSCLACKINPFISSLICLETSSTRLQSVIQLHAAAHGASRAFWTWYAERRRLGCWIAILPNQWKKSTTVLRVRLVDWSIESNPLLSTLTLLFGIICLLPISERMVTPFHLFAALIGVLSLVLVFFPHLPIERRVDDLSVRSWWWLAYSSFSSNFLPFVPSEWSWSDDGWDLDQTELQIKSRPINLKFYICLSCL